MATRPSGETKYDRKDELLKPIKVPSKKGVRRNVALARNRVRQVRRVRHKAVAGVLNATDWMGAKYLCPICRDEVPYRRAEAHNHQHKVNGDKPEHFRRQRQPAGTTVPPPEPREPSKTKAAKSTSRTAADGKKLHKLKANGKRIKQVDERRRYRRETDAIGDTMTGRPRRANGQQGTNSSNLAAAVLTAFTAWCDYQPETVEDLRAHLLSMDAALGQVGTPLTAWGAALVARNFHPAMVQPIDAAAETLVAARVNFSEAYRRFEVIYGERLNYERNQQHRPADSVFGRT